MVDPAGTAPASSEPRRGSKACRLSIFVHRADHCHHRPLYAEIVHQAHKAGLAGATVFHGMLGFSAPDSPHTRQRGVRHNVPALVVIVDTEERVRAFLPILDGLINSGLATLDYVQILE